MSCDQECVCVFSRPWINNKHNSGFSSFFFLYAASVCVSSSRSPLFSNLWLQASSKSVRHVVFTLQRVGAEVIFCLFLYDSSLRCHSWCNLLDLRVNGLFFVTLHFVSGFSSALCLSLCRYLLQMSCFFYIFTPFSSHLLFSFICLCELQRKGIKFIPNKKKTLKSSFFPLSSCPFFSSAQRGLLFVIINLD